MKLIAILLMVSATLANAQQYSETIKKEFGFEKISDVNTLVVANINGNITVEGYDGDKVIVEVARWIGGKTEARLEKGKAELQLGIMDRADTIILYVQNGCNTFSYGRSRNRDGWHNGSWNYDWNCSRSNCDTEYDYKMDVTIKVPKRINLMTSTIKDGNINISKVAGGIKANNINGSIRLTDLQRETVASTINGDVDIDYTSNPGKDCRFYSLNGDINALFQKGLAAKLSFDSFNGEFYTNINRIDPLPANIEKSNKGEGIRYKVNGNMYIVGTGGPLLDFETFNGNVYLKEK
jgi:DUF4097 and DUF4098 domain-containing protein YvlB